MRNGEGCSSGNNVRGMQDYLKLEAHEALTKAPHCDKSPNC